MISFELEKLKESLTISVDGAGIEDLARCLEFVRKSNDHIHLVIGIDLSDVIFGQCSTTIEFVTIRQVEH